MKIMFPNYVFVLTGVSCNNFVLLIELCPIATALMPVHRSTVEIMAEVTIRLKNQNGQVAEQEIKQE